jgi:hypothetical protein
MATQRRSIYRGSVSERTDYYGSLLRITGVSSKVRKRVGRIDLADRPKRPRINRLRCVGLSRGPEQKTLRREFTSACRTRVGPTHAAHLGQRAEVERAEAEFASRRIYLGVSVLARYGLRLARGCRGDRSALGSDAPSTLFVRLLHRCRGPRAAVRLQEPAGGFPIKPQRPAAARQSRRAPPHPRSKEL